MDVTGEGVVVGRFYLDETFLFEKECDIRERRDPVETSRALNGSIGAVKSRDDAEGEIYDLSEDEWKRLKGKTLRVELDTGRTAIVVLDFAECGPIWSAKSYFV
jgi:hypothetical protein